LTFLQIPDKAFHAVPGGYFRPPELDQKKRHKREKRRQEKEELQRSKDKSEDGIEEEQNRSSSESQSSNEKEMFDSKPRRRERPRRSRNSSYIDRGYESDRGPQDGSSFLPPPQKPVTVANLYPGIKPYNPADYAGPPTQEERDRASRALPTQFYSPATYPEHLSNTVMATKESNVQPENLPPPTKDAYQSPPFGSIFPHTRTQQRNSSASPSVDPIFLHTYPNAKKVSTSPFSDPASPNTGTGSRGRMQSTAQAKYTPINYTPQFYAPSPPPPIPDGMERQPPPNEYKPPPPASAVEQPRMASGPFTPQRGSPGIVVPWSDSTQQPISPAYGTVIVPYPTSGDPQNSPYGYDASPRNFSPLPNNARHNSPARSSQSPHSPSNKDGDADHDRTDNSSRDRSKSSRLREALKEHKDVEVSALGSLAGGLIGSAFGHNRTMGVMLGAAVGGLGANFVEEMREEERKSKHKKRGDGENYKGQNYKNGYDSY